MHILLAKEKEQEQETVHEKETATTDETDKEDKGWKPPLDK